MPGRLILVPTPLGNLGDITYRAVQTLESCDLVTCEDTRRTGKLLAHLCINKPIMRFDDYADTGTINKIIKALGEDLTIAYCSDAGMPGVRDPGFELVRIGQRACADVTVLPGPSAVTLAIVASGLPNHTFSFWGYLPYRSEQRMALIRKLMAKEETIIVFETSHRVHAALAEMAEIIPDREIALGRELTKLHETWYRGTPSSVIEQLGTEDRGEMVIVMAGTNARRTIAGQILQQDDQINDLPQWALNYIRAARDGGMTIRETVKPLARHMGISVSKLYQLATMQQM
jgi:16S rRNA (cytidine1402-2'-O)-methyltransferase